MADILLLKNWSWMLLHRFFSLITGRVVLIREDGMKFTKLPTRVFPDIFDGEFYLQTRATSDCNFDSFRSSYVVIRCQRCCNRYVLSINSTAFYLPKKRTRSREKKLVNNKLLTYIKHTKILFT